MLSKLLQKELAESGWIHMPLPLHEENSLEAVCAKNRFSRPAPYGKERKTRGGGAQAAER